jgi:hypothetical protein
MLDPADLTWNKDRELFCPVNRVGTVDLYMTANHGMVNANSPVMVHALQPRVVIANNAARKGATAETFQTVESSPGLEDYWQAHYVIAGGEKNNVKPDYIANIEGSPDGQWIKVSVQRDGTFTVALGGAGGAACAAAPAIGLPHGVLVDADADADRRYRQPAGRLAQ